MRKSNFLFFLILRTVCSTVVALACSGNYMVYSVLNQQPISRWVTNPTNTNKHNTKDKHQITHTVSHAECLEVNQNEQRILKRHVLLKETTVWKTKVCTLRKTETFTCIWDTFYVGLCFLKLNDFFNDSCFASSWLWREPEPGTDCWWTECDHWELALADQSAAQRSTHMWRITSVSTLGGHCRPLL